MDRSKLTEKMKQTGPFNLPKEISFEKLMLVDGSLAYVFRHSQMGELGRLVVVSNSNNTSQFVCEVAGDPKDPMTVQRKSILEPITEDLIARMNFIFGQTDQPHRVYESPKTMHTIKSKIMPCHQCGKPSALLIFAENAETQAELEDCARLMYAPMQEMNVPTWIVGFEREISINGELAGEGLVMKSWPDRSQASLIVSTELNSYLEERMNNHCL